jgi:hypothetical protein
MLLNSLQALTQQMQTMQRQPWEPTSVLLLLLLLDQAAWQQQQQPMLLPQ